MAQNLTDNEIGTQVHIDENLRLDHVVGQEEAVRSLRGLVNRIVYSKVFDIFAVEKPKAIALTGPPGCGKTHSIRALANEVSCPLMELFYEDIASHLYDESIRRLSAFKHQVDELAKTTGHVLVLIDEADSLFQSRFDSNAHASDKKKTNFFLRWIDGDLEGSSDFTIIATSNAWDTVDPALKRSGRFVEVKYKPLLSSDVKKALLVHIELAELKAGKTLFEKFSVDDFDLPDGVSGADVKEIVREALLAKADSFLDVYKTHNEDLPSALSSLSLITSEELKTVANDYISKLDIKTKRVGFARN